MSEDKTVPGLVRDALADRLNLPVKSIGIVPISDTKSDLELPDTEKDGPMRSAFDHLNQPAQSTKARCPGCGGTDHLQSTSPRCPMSAASGM